MGSRIGLTLKKNKYKEKTTENTGIRSMSMRFKIVEINDASFGQKRDKQQQQLENGKIILVGINSNSHFGDGNGLEMMVRKLNQDPKIVYARNAFDSYGLNKFNVIHRDDEKLTEKAKRNSLASQQDYFVKRNQYGRIETWIDCSVNAAVNNVCKHHYYPDSKRPIYVYLAYRAEYLPHWEQIQNYTTQRINSFGSF